MSRKQSFDHEDRISSCHLGRNHSLTILLHRHYPDSVTVDPSGTYVYVANFGDNDVSQYRINADGSLTAITTAVPAGSGPYSITVDPSGKYAYVANSDSNDISQYRINADGSLTAITTAVPAGSSPWSITVDPSDKYAYVANHDSNDVSQYNITADGSLFSMPTPTAPALPGPSAITMTPTTTAPLSYVEDYFDRGNELPIQSPWANDSSWHGVGQIWSTKYTSGSSSSAVSYRTDITPSADQWAEGIWYGGYSGLVLRIQPGLGTAYFFWFNNDTGHVAIWKWAAGSGSMLGSTVSVTPNLGVDVWRFEVTGVGATVTLKGYQNGNLIITRTDSTADRIVDAGKIGIHAYGTHLTGGYVDNWRGGNLPETPLATTTTTVAPTTP